VSTSTILRFCRKVGCDGFSEFKVKLKLYLESESEESVKGMKEFAYEFMERTLKGKLDEVITEAAHEVVRANHVLFVGFGSSGI
ncbi:transcriptional regulator, partial [Escherichia coli]|nr:transcriptional regulator [Escherichia coli]